MWRTRTRSASIALVLGLSVLFLLPTAGASQSSTPSTQAGSPLASHGPAYAAVGRAPVDLQTAFRIGSTSLAAATPLATHAGGPTSAPPSFSDYSRPTGSSAGPALVPSTSAASVVASTSAASGMGLNAYDSGQSNFISGFGPLDVEPPDQGLCAGGGYVLETVNLAVQVYNSTSFTPVSGVTPLANLVGFPIDQQFGVSKVGGGYILSDPRCLFDTGTGHWFISFLYLGGRGVFSHGGRFPLGANTFGAEFVLASTGHSPMGPFDIYMINVSSDPLASNCPCFGDQPLLGADANTIILSTNEFPIFTGGFNGAQTYLFDKRGMAQGLPAVNVVHFNIGLSVNSPDGSCAASGGLYCFYSVDPTVSPTAKSYDTSGGGTAWAVSSLDFTGAGDTRIAVWSFGDTSSIRSLLPTISLSLDLMTGLEPYSSLGQLVPQQSGAIPLGDTVYSNTGAGGGGCVAACTVGELASNGDGTWDTATYAQGAIWVAVSTAISTTPSVSMGVAFWVINAAGSSVSLATQGYIAVAGASLLFPSIGVGPSGNALVAFTLTGTTYYPSSAFAWISSTSTGPIGGRIYVSAAGQSPQDGFTEYQSIQTPYYRPRWGDYTWAIWFGGKIYFSTEYIQSPNCSDSAFVLDPTCGATRDEFANWGTSINSVATT
jgi:hypothetical protein